MAHSLPSQGVSDTALTIRRPPGTGRRLVICIGLGVLFGSALYVAERPPSVVRSDWEEIHAASRALLDGEDPYQAMQQAHAAGRFQYPLVYPGTALVLAAPLATLPFPVAVGLWAGISLSALAWALTREAWWGLLGLLSAPVGAAYLWGQWSSLLTGATAIPVLGLVWAAKPTIGIPLFAGWPSKQAAMGGIVLVILSLVLLPHWPAAMHASTASVPFVRPILTRPGGFLLLLALLRWRQPEGRLLAALAVVPQTTFVYELVPLLLIPKTARQMSTLVLLSWTALLVYQHQLPVTSETHFADLVDGSWPYWFLLIYLPCLYLVLRRSDPETRPHF